MARTLTIFAHPNQPAYYKGGDPKLQSPYRGNWKTPKALYEELDREFHFDYDPCPPNPTENGIFSDWGQSSFVNPPYGKAIASWLIKAIQESRKGKTVVFLLPVYADVAWFHDYVLQYASQVRFLRGRLKFDDRPGNAPFASMIVVFKQSKETK